MNKILTTKTALLIIDVQNDYFEEGLFPLEGAVEALENITTILELFRQGQLKVIHVKHVSLREDAPFFRPNTKGCEIHSLLTPREDEAVVIKHKPDSFSGTSLDKLLKEQEIETLVVVGMMSHHCVDTTVRSASNDYKMVVIHDGCATRALRFQNEMIQADIVHKTMMAALQGFANVMSTDALLDQVERSK